MLKIGDKVTHKAGLWEGEYELVYTNGEQSVIKTPGGNLSVVMTHKLIPAFVPHLFTDQERQDFIDKYGATKFKIRHNVDVSDEYEIIGIGYTYDDGRILKDAYKTNKTYIKIESIEALHERGDIIWMIPPQIYTGEMQLRWSGKYYVPKDDVRAKNGDICSIFNGMQIKGDNLIHVAEKIGGRKIKFTIEVLKD